jgi:6-phosphofructokinase 1
VRLAEVNLGDVLKSHLRSRLKELGLDTSLVTKDIGYELRCADPIPFDMEYTRDLGYCAAQYTLDGGTDAMVTLVNGRFEPMPFSQMLDPTTGRTRVRLVDVSSEQYRIARRYMVRLSRHDFEDAENLARLASVVGQTPQEFQSQFGYLVANDAPSPPQQG